MFRLASVVSKTKLLSPSKSILSSDLGALKRFTSFTRSTSSLTKTSNQNNSTTLQIVSSQIELNSKKNALVQFQKNLFSTTNDQNPSSPIPPDALHRDNPDLWNLRVIADKNPKDVGAQVAYLRKLNDFNPQEVVLRASNEKFAKNEFTHREALLASLKANPTQFYANLLRDNTLQVTIKESWRSKITTFILVGAGLVFLGMLMFGGSSSPRGGGLQGMFEGHYTPVVIPETKFADVKGNEESKEELQDIAEYLKNPAAFSKFKIKMPRGVLLTGPPGCGKTLLARALAGEAGVPFFHTSGSEFEEMLVGVGAKRMRELFAKASEMSPCIIFIDEIDAIGGRRDSLDLNRTKLTLNQLLVQLDGFEKTEGVVVIAATNMPDTLDPALTRPGRFDRQIALNLPDVRARAEILKMYLNNKGAGAYDVDIEFMAKQTIGFSGASLENLVNLAAISALKNKRDKINLTDMISAKDTVRMGPERKSFVFTPSHKRLVAYHEAGHAVVAYHNKQPIEKASLMPRGRSLGHVAYQLKDENYETKEEYLHHIDTAMGGRASEEIWFGETNVTSGASNDFQAATNLARNMVEKLGMSEKVGKVYWDEKELQKASPETRSLVESEVKSVIDKSYSKAFGIIKENKDSVERLAEALLKYEILSGPEVHDLIEGKPLKRSILSPSAPATPSVKPTLTPTPVATQQPPISKQKPMLA